MERQKIEIHCVINDRPTTVRFDPTRRLLDVLREKLYLTGSKEGCGKGECGACTVIMNGKPVDTCLIMGFQAEGATITTIEGLEQDGRLHPLQEAFMDCGSVQCGICIPGMIVAGKALLDENTEPTLEEIKYGLAGNLCRCTGYVKMFEAVRQAGRRIDAESVGGEKPTAAATLNGAPETDESLRRYRPQTLDEALQRLAQHGASLRCVAGGTDILVKAKDGQCSTQSLFDVSAIAELRAVRAQGDRLWVGSGATHDDVVRSPLMREYAPALVDGCAIIGGPQIRNRGTIGGNLGNASPAADSVPALYTLEAEVEIVSLKKQRVAPIEEFFLGPGKTVLQPTELIRGVSFAKRPQMRGAFLRLGQRRAQAISKVSLAASAQMEGRRFRYLRLALGAVAPTVLRARKAEEILLNEGWNAKSLKAARQAVKQEAKPIDDLRSRQDYRREMCAVLLERALTAVAGPV